jgi:hypothetical protein
MVDLWRPPLAVMTPGWFSGPMPASAILDSRNFRYRLRIAPRASTTSPSPDLITSFTAWLQRHHITLEVRSINAFGHPGIPSSIEVLMEQNGDPP